jgi:translation elongation factor EF-1beta
MATLDYLREHQVESFVHGMVGSLRDAKPGNPFKAMAEYAVAEVPGAAAWQQGEQQDHQEEGEEEQQEQQEDVEGELEMVSAVLSVKPLDSETDLGHAESLIRALRVASCPQLAWGGCRQEPMAFGLKKLVLLARFAGGDEEGIEALAEAIEGLEDEELVGSVDVDYVGHPQRAADLFGAVGLDNDGATAGAGLTAENALEAAVACQALLRAPANKLAIEAQLQMMAGPSPDQTMLMFTMAPVAVHILRHVLEEYMFEAAPTGLLRFAQRLHAFALEDAEVAAVADALQAELHLPDLDGQRPSVGEGAGDAALETEVVD